MWMDWKILVGVPHEMPVVGYGGETVNALRLYSARASDDFDMENFNSGDYVQAVQEAIGSETISKVLYPSDKVQKGKELRLLQEYFFVACALRDILRRFLREGHPIDRFADKIAIQLNDTHPALAVAELMRLFVDEHDVVVGAGVGDDRRHARLHEPHPPPRGAREVAAAARGDGPPAAPADHLRGEPALPRRGRPPRARRPGDPRPRLDDRGGGAEAGADGAARRRREPLDQRRRRAPLPPHHREPLPRPLPPPPGAVQQQDERRHAAALAPEVEPRPRLAPDRGGRARAGSPTTASCASRSTASPRTRHSGSASAT